MERNNGVTAIIYLAFVRNRTLQPYFRSADTDAIFHSLTTFTFTQTPDALSTLSSQDRVSLLWVSFVRTSSEKNRKKRLYRLIWDSQGIQSSHRHQCKEWELPLRVSYYREGFNPRWAGSWNLPRQTECILALDPANLGRTAVLIRQQAAFYAALNTTHGPLT